MSSLPAFARALCDDAAVFPPGLSPLPDAVLAHRRHTASQYAELVGPLVIAAPALTELGPLLTPGETLDIAVTAPDGPGQLPAVFAAAKALPVRLCALEVAVPAGQSAMDFRRELDRESAEAQDVAIFVEVPRDPRRPEIIKACASGRYQAKFRTGGVRAELHPDEAELATATRLVVDAGVPFKATAGLHHAIRNTDPETGFEQHGFLNLLLAVCSVLDGAGEPEVRAVLAERDATAVATRLAGLDDAKVAAVRSLFRSFGTCSIIEPLAELVDLGLVPASALSGEGVSS